MKFRIDINGFRKVKEESVYIIFYLLLLKTCFMDKSILGAFFDSAFTFTSIYILYFIFNKTKLKYLVFFVLSTLLSSNYLLNKWYGGLNVGILGSLLDTNINESVEFISSLSLLTIMKTVFLFFCFFVLSCNLSFKSKKLIHTNIITFILICIISSYFAFKVVYSDEYKDRLGTQYITKDYKITLIDSFMMLSFNRNIIMKYYFIVNQFISLNEVKPVKSEWKNVISDKEKQKKIYVINIGESARKDHFKIYGYKEDTTYNIPGLYIVNGAISPSVVTRLSVPRILSKNNNVESYNQNLNIISLANDAGFETYWISNQAKSGLNDTPISVIAENANHRYYANYDFSNAKPDNVLLPNILKAIKEKTDKNKVIFVHTMGSHSDFCKRFDKDYIINYSSNDVINCYDNSINYGFKFLLKIRNMLIETGNSFNIVYFSDHGLVKTENPPYFIHGNGNLFNKDAVEVPFFIMTENNNNQPIIVNRRYNLRGFYSTFADILHIKADQINNNESVFYNTSGNLLDNEILDGSYKVRKIQLSKHTSA